MIKSITESVIGILLMTLIIMSFIAAVFYGTLAVKHVIGQRYTCEYDDQLMYSDGTCIDLDSILDSYNDTKG